MSRNTKKRRGKSSQVSHSSRFVARLLGGLIMLSILGVAVLIAYNLGVRDEEEPLRRVTQPAPAQDNAAQQPQPSAAQQRQAKYSFYDELKKRNSEVQAEVAAKTRALENTPAAKGTYYRVQVGAFKEEEQADLLRARLILRDYPVTVLRSDNYHLVQVGPYQDREEARKVEESLKKSGFKVLLKKFESN